MTRKAQLANVRRVLVKVGSAVLTGEDGLDLNIIEQLVADIASLRERGIQVILVSSGAIASGIPAIDKLDQDPVTTIKDGDLVEIDAPAVGQKATVTINRAS